MDRGLERGRRAVARDDVTVRVPTDHGHVSQLRDALERADRIMAEGDEIAEDPVAIGATAPVDVGQHRVERDRVAVQVRDQCEAHRSRCYRTSSAITWSASGCWAPTISVVIPLSFHASSRSAIRSLGPMSEISSTSSSGTAAIASRLLPSRYRSWIFVAASSNP